MGSVGAPEIVVLLLSLLIVGVPFYLLVRAGYRRGISHGTRPDNVALVVLALVIFTGASAIYWIARYIGARKYRQDATRLPAAAVGTSHPSGWYGDPLRRYDARYFDGEQWTERVKDRGIELQDKEPKAEPVRRQPSSDSPPPRVAPSGDASGSAIRDASSGPSPNWYRDPSGRYELRYYDGSAWTAHVATGGVLGNDPPAGR